MSETIFIDGMTWQEPPAKAPDFVKGSIIVDINKFWKFADKNQQKGGVVRVAIKQSKSGNIYLSLDDYKPGDKKAEPKGDDIVQTVQLKAEDVDNEIPF